MSAPFDPHAILSQFRPEQWEQIRLDALKELASRKLHEFIKQGWRYMDPAAFVDGWHIGAICLPANAMILTEDGEKPIGEIVASRWRGRVLSYSHQINRAEWKPILAWMTSPPQPMVQIDIGDGSPLRVSGNHPVFLKGHGYTRADEVKADDVVLQALRDPSGSRPRQALPSMLSRDQSGGGVPTERTALSELWEFVCSFARAHGTVLQPEMFWRCQDKARDRYLPQVWRQKSVGQSWMPSLLCHIALSSSAYSLLPMWHASATEPCGTKGQLASLWGLLRFSMFCRFCSGTEQPGLYRWWYASGIPRFLSGCSEANTRTRRSSLLSLFGRGEAGRTSHRPGQGEQQNDQSRRALSPMSQSSEGDIGTSYSIGEHTVRSVECDLRLCDEPLFNIEVADNNNYFAQDILVHNCEHLEAVTSGQIRRLIINQPPRTQKSLTVSVAWPAWTWAQRASASPLAGPSTSFMFASYAQTLSVRDSVKCRRLIESPWYQQSWGKTFALTSDQNTKIRFENSEGGYRLATSVGGYLTGEGASIIGIDDPENTIEAESEVVRQGVLDWWDEAMSTRLNDPKTGAFVIVMQRLHENDLVGHILEKGGEDWCHLMLPMRLDERRVCVTVLGFEDPRTEAGELLWPERFGEAEVAALETALGPYAASSQLQQSPSPRGGGIIKREWWLPWPPAGEEDQWTTPVQIETPDGRMKVVNRVGYPDFELIVVYTDTAYTEKEENDWSACTVWGVFRYRGVPKLMLVHAWRDRLELHALVTRLLESCRKRKADILLVEGKASGLSVAQEIRRLMRPGNFTVKVDDPKRQDKVARLTAVQPLFAGGMVYAPDTTWAEMVINEVSQAPKSKYDDLTDCCSGALLYLRRSGIALLTPEAKEEETRSLTYRKPMEAPYDFG